ncbi:hypothetical protein [Streptomyces sp. NBC_00829]|nr:hypothetical protein OG293_02500 [Streptomyces sp. NBC_00829]
MTHASTRAALSEAAIDELGAVRACRVPVRKELKKTSLSPAAFG